MFKKKTETSTTSIARQKPKTTGNQGMGILLPPPPGSNRAANAAAVATVSSSLASQPNNNQIAANNSDSLLFDLGSPPKPVNKYDF